MQLKKTLIVVSFFVFTISMAGVGNIWSQSCTDENIDVAALLQKASRSGVGTARVLVNEVAAVAGEKAIDELRKFTDEKKYPDISGTVSVSLAKLGDDAAFSVIKENSRKKNEVYGRILTVVPILQNVGDERAIRAVMEYLVENQDDKDVPVHSIAEGMNIIAQKRHVPKIPSRNGREKTDKEYINEWVQWWERNKDAPVGRPVYESVENPYLRCLARKVEWGIHGALLSIANYGGAEAEATLRKFPSPPPDAYNRAFGSFLGNLNVALAKVGDQQEFDKIVDDLISQPNHDNPFDKLRYIGGLRAVGALVDALGFIYDERSSGKDINKWWHKSVLNTLARMVQNAPLGYGAELTEENYNIWREWWETKKDIAVIIPYNKQQQR